MSQGKWDPHASITCPYDPLHVITAQRFQRHVHKCRKNHPEKDLVQCSFNANHFVLRNLIRQHLVICPDKPQLENNIIKLTMPNSQVSQSFCGNVSMPKSKQIVKCEGEEDWDEEIELVNSSQTHLLNKLHITQTWLDSKQTHLNPAEHKSQQLVRDEELQQVTLLNSHLSYLQESRSAFDNSQTEQANGDVFSYETNGICLYERPSNIDNTVSFENDNIHKIEIDSSNKRYPDIDSNEMQTVKTNDFSQYKNPLTIENLTRAETENIYQSYPLSIGYESESTMENIYSYQDVSSPKKDDTDVSSVATETDNVSSVAEIIQSSFFSTSKYLKNPKASTVVQPGFKVTQSDAKLRELSDSKRFSRTIGRGALKEAILNYNFCKT